MCIRDSNKEEEVQPTQNTTQSAPAPAAAVSNSSKTDVKDAFEDLFNN